MVTNVQDAQVHILAGGLHSKGCFGAGEACETVVTKVNQAKRFRIILRMDESNSVGLDLFSYIYPKL